jgi:hypothetical protein
MEKFAILYKMWLQKILRIINGIIILSGWLPWPLQHSGPKPVYKRNLSGSWEVKLVCELKRFRGFTHKGFKRLGSGFGIGLGVFIYESVSGISKRYFSISKAADRFKN